MAGFLRASTSDKLKFTFSVLLAARSSKIESERLAAQGYFVQVFVLCLLNGRRKIAQRLQRTNVMM
jgi:hypothetical protein